MFAWLRGSLRRSAITSVPARPRWRPALESLEDRTTPTALGGVDLGDLPNYLFVFTDGSKDANWQGATKGFAGDVVVNGLKAAERTSGGVPFAGTIYTNDSTLGAWQHIVDQNPGQAHVSTGQTTLVDTLTTQLISSIQDVSAMSVTAGFASRSASSLNGLNTQNGVAETIVINVTSGFQVNSQIKITGDANDVFVLRWDTDANPANGFQGQVKFQSGGAIIPQGGLTAGNFIHVAGDINASGGGSTPTGSYPQGPRTQDGQGSLVDGGKNFSGGGFFTGYWLTTGAPTTRDAASGLFVGGTSSLSNAIFVGGWYSLTTKFSMTSGTSGVHVSPPDLGTPPEQPLAKLSGTVLRNGDTVQPGVRVVLSGTNDQGAFSMETFTDTNGEYFFTDLRPGTYTVTEYPPSTVGASVYTGTESTAGLVNGTQMVGTANGTTIGSVVLTFADVGTEYNFTNFYEFGG